jgi:transposase InsO family protein
LRIAAELAVEAFGDAILPGLAGLDQRGANAVCGDPGQERLGNELRTVVARRRSGALGSLTKRDSTSITRGKRMRPSTSIANPDECLSLEWFRTRAEAKVIIESWRQHYKAVRPHASLGYLLQLGKQKTQHLVKQRAGASAPQPVAPPAQ